MYQLDKSNLGFGGHVWDTMTDDGDTKSIECGIETRGEKGVPLFQNKEKGGHVYDVTQGKHIVRLKGINGDNIEWLRNVEKCFIEQILGDIKKKNEGDDIPIELDDSLDGVFTSYEKVKDFKKFYNVIHENNDGQSSFKIKKHATHKAFNDSQKAFNKSFKVASQPGMPDFETNETSWYSQLKRAGTHVPWPLDFFTFYLVPEESNGGHAKKRKIEDDDDAIELLDGINGNPIATDSEPKMVTSEDKARLNTIGYKGANQDQLDYNDRLLRSMAVDGSAGESCNTCGCVSLRVLC